MVGDIYDKLFEFDASATKSTVFVAADFSRVPQDKADSESLVSTEQLLASIQSLKQLFFLIQSQMVTKDQLRLSLNTRSADVQATNLPPPCAEPLMPTAPPLSQESTNSASLDSTLLTVPNSATASISSSPVSSAGRLVSEVTSSSICH